MKELNSIAAISIAMILIVALASTASAKEKRIHKKEVPKVVLSAFEKAYPKAKVKGYTTEEEDGKTFFEVESHLGKTSLDVSYLADGTVTEIEEGVSAGSLPDAVKATLKANYPKGRVAKAEKRTVGTEVTYELKIATGKTLAGAEIDPSGKVLRKSKGDSEKD